MSEQAFFNSLIIGWFAMAVIVFAALFFVAAPYGRHFRRGWSAGINEKLGWLIMEAPAPLVFAICFAFRSNAVTITTLAFLVLWEAHYMHRAFIYPLSLRRNNGGIPVMIVSFGFFFNMVNGYLNGRYIFSLYHGYNNEWLNDPRFIAGVSLFIAGFFINRWADRTLHNLRQPGEAAYLIPQGGLYRWISCPNYFGEVVIWVGWAVMTWSLPGLAFAAWTVANLVPRARSHHAWYRAHFNDYPPERRAFIPGLW